MSKIVIQAIYSFKKIEDDLTISIKQNTWATPIYVTVSVSTGIILPLGVMTYSLMQTLTERKLMAHRKSHRSVLIEE